MKMGDGDIADARVYHIDRCGVVVQSTESSTCEVVGWVGMIGLGVMVECRVSLTSD